MIPKRIISDPDIADLCVIFWPEITKYQARTMMTIFLCENGGDANALYLNQTGLFAWTLDRGLGAINEMAIREVRNNVAFPAEDFCDPLLSVAMARDTWDWRFDVAHERNMTYGGCLIYAYSGWSMYKNKPAAWGAMWTRAGTALKV